MSLADGCLLVGFGLVVVGVAHWSVPGACIVAGVILMVSGLQGYRRA